MTTRSKSAPQQAVDGLMDAIGAPLDYAQRDVTFTMEPATRRAPPAHRSLALAYTLLLIAAALAAGYGVAGAFWNIAP